MMQDSLKSSRHQSARRNFLTQFRLGLMFLAFSLILGGAMPAEATAQRDFAQPGLPIGDDNDNQDNPTIQVPEAPGNQSLDNEGV